MNMRVHGVSTLSRRGEQRSAQPQSRIEWQKGQFRASPAPRRPWDSPPPQAAVRGYIPDNPAPAQPQCRYCAKARNVDRPVCSLLEVSERQRIALLLRLRRAQVIQRVRQHGAEFAFHAFPTCRRCRAVWFRRLETQAQAARIMDDRVHRSRCRRFSSPSKTRQPIFVVRLIEIIRRRDKRPPISGEEWPDPLFAPAICEKWPYAWSASLSCSNVAPSR